MITKLEDFLEEISERTTQNNQYPVLTSSKNGLFLQDDYFNKQVASKDNTGYKVIRRGEFTYRAMSDTGEFYPNILECADIGIVSPAYPVFKISKDIILPDYLKYYFKSRKFQNSIFSFVQGSTRSSMKFGKMKTISIDLPDKEKQIQTIKMLDFIKKQIELKKEELEQLDNLIKARFVEMFSDDYEEVELSELGKISTGSTPPMKNKDYYENADMPFYKPGDFIDGVSNIDRSGSFVDARAESVSRIMDPGTVAVTCIGIIGKIGIIRRQGICNQQINFIAPNDNINSTYLAYAIETKKKCMQEKANAPVVPILNKTNFSKVTIPLAPVELQNQFAAFVTQVDKSKFTIQKSLEKTQLLFDSLMQEYFG